VEDYYWRANITIFEDCVMRCDFPHWAVMWFVGWRRQAHNAAVAISQSWQEILDGEMKPLVIAVFVATVETAL